MFSPWIYKKRIFGIDVDIEFDFWGSIFNTWQKIYFWRVFYFWSHKMTFDGKGTSTLPFIKLALTHLPNTSYVIFFFDNYRNIAVQFMRSDRDIHLVIPVWKSNPYEGRRPEISKLIRKSKINKSAIYRKSYGRGKIDVSINFHQDYAKAANFTILIVKELFHFQYSELFEYETHRLVPMRSKEVF